MSQPLPTVRITDDQIDGGVLINERDFDAQVHELWTEAEADDADLTQIKGIGAGTQAKLFAAEIDSLEVLASAVAADVAEIVGTTEAKAQAWIDAAAKL